MPISSDNIMGYYIDTPLHKGKADYLLASVPGTVRATLGAKPEPGQVPIVVVHNPMFEAAGIAYSEDEFARFTRPTEARKREQLFMPREAVVALQPVVKNEITWP